MADSVPAPRSRSTSRAWLSWSPRIEPEVEAWLEGGEHLLEQAAKAEGRVLGSGRGAARAVTVEAQAGVWRINRHGGLLGGLQADRYRSPRRLEGEVALSTTLREHGIDTPEVLLALAVRRGPWWRQHLITREVPHAVTVFEARHDPAAMQAADRLLQQVFDLGLWATDLHPGNLLWQADAERCWLIDLAGATLRPRPLTEGERQTRLQRFQRYFVKHGGVPGS